MSKSMNEEWDGGEQGLSLAADLGSWRDRAVEDPFEDSRVRQRIAELITRAAVTPPKLGG